MPCGPFDRLRMGLARAPETRNSSGSVVVYPVAASPTDETAPSLRDVRDWVCPSCRGRYVDIDILATGACPKDGTPLMTATAFAEMANDAMVGKTLAGRFTLHERLGAGSMGTVYRAKQHPVGRDVAVKILRSDRAIDEAARARFLREARANSLLSSPHTVTVFDFGQSDDGHFFLAMELLEGEALGARLKRAGRLSVEATVETARQVLRSLAEAHGKGIIHRDLKPDNVFFARAPDSGAQVEEIVKVLDFGIAKMLGDAAPLDAVETQAGTVFGTPRYMSPEQAQAKPLDARSDLYSLGVLLYHALTGRPPFVDDDAIVVMARHIKSAPKPLAEVWPEGHHWPEVCRVVMRALSKDPSARPSDSESMAAALAEAYATDLASMSGVRVTSSRRFATPGLSFSPATPSSSGAVPVMPPSAPASGQARAAMASGTPMPAALDTLDRDLRDHLRPRGWLKVGAATVGAVLLLASAGAVVARRGAVSTAGGSALHASGRVAAAPRASDPTVPSASVAQSAAAGEASDTAEVQRDPSAPAAGSAAPANGNRQADPSAATSRVAAAASPRRRPPASRTNAVERSPRPGPSAPSQYGLFE
jgi:serine/threonine-protein kinase